MVLYHNRISRALKKRVYGLGGKPAETAVGVARGRRSRVKGGKSKLRLLSAGVVNALVDGKYVRCEIVSVRENAANKDYVRRNVITRGAVVSAKSPEGRELSVRVTSRPGQDGVVNGIVV